jgi:hypothetical protein
VLDYSEETNQLDIVTQFDHEDQIWALESSPEDAELIVTSRLFKAFSLNCTQKF